MIEADIQYIGKLCLSNALRNVSFEVYNIYTEQDKIPESSFVNICFMCVNFPAIAVYWIHRSTRLETGDYLREKTIFNVKPETKSRELCSIEGKPKNWLHSDVDCIIINCMYVRVLNRKINKQYIFGSPHQSQLLIETRLPYSWIIRLGALFSYIPIFFLYWKSAKSLTQNSMGNYVAGNL